MDPSAWQLAAQRLRARVPTEPRALARWLEEAGELLAVSPPSADPADQEALATTFGAAMTQARALGLVNDHRTFTGTAGQGRGGLRAVEYEIDGLLDRADPEAAT